MIGRRPNKSISRIVTSASAPSRFQRISRIPKEPKEPGAEEIACDGVPSSLQAVLAFLHVSDSLQCIPYPTWPLTKIDWNPGAPAKCDADLTALGSRLVIPSLSAVVTLVAHACLGQLSCSWQLDMG